MRLHKLLSHVALVVLFVLGVQISIDPITATAARLNHLSPVETRLMNNIAGKLNRLGTTDRLAHYISDQGFDVVGNFIAAQFRENYRDPSLLQQVGTTAKAACSWAAGKAISFYSACVLDQPLPEATSQLVGNGLVNGAEIVVRAEAVRFGQYLKDNLKPVAEQVIPRLPLPPVHVEGDSLMASGIGTVAKLGKNTAGTTTVKIADITLPLDATLLSNSDTAASFWFQVGKAAEKLTQPKTGLLQRLTDDSAYAAFPFLLIACIILLLAFIIMFLMNKGLLGLVREQQDDLALHDEALASLEAEVRRYRGFALRSTIMQEVAEGVQAQNVLYQAYSAFDAQIIEIYRDDRLTKTERDEQLRLAHEGFANDLRESVFTDENPTDALGFLTVFTCRNQRTYPQLGYQLFETLATARDRQLDVPVPLELLTLTTLRQGSSDPKLLEQINVRINVIRNELDELSDLYFEMQKQLFDSDEAPSIAPRERATRDGVIIVPQFAPALPR